MVIQRRLVAAKATRPDYRLEGSEIPASAWFPESSTATCRSALVSLSSNAIKELAGLRLKIFTAD